MPTLADAIGGKERVIGGPFGSKLTQADYVPSGVPVIRGSNMEVAGRYLGGAYAFVSEEKTRIDLASNIAYPGDIVVTQRGTLGQVAIIPDAPFDRYVISQSQMAISCDTTKCYPLFVYYFLRSPQFFSYLEAETIQVGVPHINLGLLRNLPTSWPGIAEQENIAAVLGALDDQIELNLRMSKTLEAMAQAIFKDWFVDFGPSRTKANSGPRYLDHDLWTQFPDTFDDKGRPKGWREMPLLDHAKLISGGTPKTDIAEYWHGSIAWASAKDVSQCPDPFIIQTERTISRLGLDNSSTRMVPRLATVVVARGATTGRFCMMGREMAMNQTCYALHSINERPFWLNLAFAHLVNDLVHSAHGSVFDTITTRTIESARVIFASGPVMRKFEELITPLFERALSNVNESFTLTELRNLLLPKLISGEIRLRDAEKLVEKVA